MPEFLKAVDGYKTYIVCALTIVYEWIAYFLSQNQDITNIVSSAQVHPSVDFNMACTVTMAALGAAFLRHGVQKAGDAAAPSPPTSAA